MAILAAFILVSEFSPEAKAVVGLSSYLPPLITLFLAAVFSLLSWIAGSGRPRALALFQFLDITFYSSSFIGLSVFSTAPASYVFAGLYGLCCVLWGSHFTITAVGVLSVILGPMVMISLHPVDLVTVLIICVGAILFVVSTSMAKYRKQQITHTKRSQDVLDKLERLIARQNPASVPSENARVATMVHELKNELLPTCIDLEEALETIRDEHSHSLVTRSLEDVRRLIKWMETSLREMNLEEKEPDYFPLDELREEAELLSQNNRNGAIVRVEELPQVLVKGQVDMITLCLRSLIENAMEAGARAVSLSGHFSTDSSTVVLALSDDGPGLPPEVEKNIFKPYNTHGKPHGVGLGIYLAGLIVRASGGRIVLDDTGPEGTTFLMELPAFRPKTGLLTDESPSVSGDVEKP